VAETTTEVMTTAQGTQSIEIMDKRFGLHWLRGLPPDALDYALFLPGIWLACGLGISLRLIGPLFVAFPIGSCLLYALLRQTVPPRLICFCLFLCNTDSR
jgi:hypothetical protein